MQVPLWLLLIDVLLWVEIFLIHSLVLRAAPLSRFELHRRAQNGDGDAQRLDKRNRLLPRIQTLRRILESALLVIAIALTIALFGWLLGTLFATVLSLLMGTIGRFQPVASFVSRIYGPREQQVLTAVENWTWLDWFRGISEDSREPIASSKAELQHIIDNSSTVLTHDELRRVKASLMLDSRSVEDVMTPVSMIEVADVHDSLGPLVLDGLHKTGHSRFPVIDGDIHHIVGILYLHEIVNLKSTKPTVREAMDTRVHYIHEQQSLEHALHGFLRTHRHLFVVVNDYRETVGVLSLEDVLESLLGKKIIDEFDKYDDLRAVAESNPRKNNLPKGKTDV